MFVSKVSRIPLRSTPPAFPLKICNTYVLRGISWGRNYSKCFIEKNKIKKLKKKEEKRKRKKKAHIICGDRWGSEDQAPSIVHRHLEASPDKVGVEEGGVGRRDPGDNGIGIIGVDFWLDTDRKGNWKRNRGDEFEEKKEKRTGEQERRKKEQEKEIIL